MKKYVLSRHGWRNIRHLRMLQRHDCFAAEVKQVHAGTKHEKTYLLAIELAKDGQMTFLETEKS